MEKWALLARISTEKIINEKFVDYYKSLDKDKQQKSKIALSYYLSKPDSDFERVFESCLPPFDPPANARNFFVWIGRN